MNVVAEVQALQKQRADLASQLRMIDLQLADIRRALGIQAIAEPDADSFSSATTHEARGGRTRKAWTAEGAGQTKDDILAALAVREPLRTSELRAIVKQTTAANVAANMATRGELARRRLTEGSSEYSYARTADVFAGADREAAEAAEAIEAG